MRPSPLSPIPRYLDMPTDRSRRFYRLTLAVLIVAIVPLGYFVRFAKGMTPDWFSNTFGNLAYECFWIWLAIGLFPKLRPWRVALAVCLVTCGLEFLQLCQAPILVAARSQLLGRLILGSNFDWGDFPGYFLGSAIGGWMGARIRRFWCSPRHPFSGDS